MSRPSLQELYDSRPHLGGNRPIEEAARSGAPRPRLTLVLVVDASAIASALADDKAPGRRARAALADGPLFAPELIDIEVAATGAGTFSQDTLTPAAPRWRCPSSPRWSSCAPRIASLMSRIWALRDNVTPYDAAYVALAEALGAPLVTADAGLAGAPGPRCEFRVLR